MQVIISSNKRLLIISYTLCLDVKGSNIQGLLYVLTSGISTGSIQEPKGMPKLNTCKTHAVASLL